MRTLRWNCPLTQAITRLAPTVGLHSKVSNCRGGFYARPDPQMPLAKEPETLQTFTHVLDQINHAVAVAPFVVVPRNNLDKIATQDQRLEGAKNARVRVAF
jgi:hypothetical protein